MHDEGSIATLFRREFPRLVRSLSVAFGPEPAADAVQEAFIAADRRWGQIATYSDPAGWLRRVALNRLLNERRLQRRRTEILAGVRPHAAVELSVDALDLADAVKQLPTQQRVAVCLRYLGDYTIDEVAAAMELAPGTVKAHLHAARASLKLTLTEVEP